jgi:polysaccharide pyruvyl transferase WcaK-like protein
MVTFLRFLVRIIACFVRPWARKRRPGMLIECLVVGYGGANNTGAEARTVEAIKQMLDADPRISITLTSLDRRRTLRYLDEHERLRVAGINSVFIFSMPRLVMKSDIVVLVEGSCFKENFSPALLWFFMFTADLAQRLGLPTVAYGVDAGPLTPSNAKWTLDVADRMDLLMMRTSAAADLLRSSGVKRNIAVTTDTAFTLVPADRVWAETVLVGQGIDLKKPIAGIAFEEFFWWPVVPSILKAALGVTRDRYKSIYYHTWPNDGRRKSAVMKNAMSSYADWIAKEFDAQVVFFAMESLDIGPCRDVMHMMKASSILIDADHASAAKMAALLRRLDWLITCRYHAFILAMCGSVPAIGLGHDERIASIMDELDLLSNYFISYEEERLFPSLKQKTETLFAEKDSIKKGMERVLPRYLARMAENKKLFGNLLKERFVKG